MASSKLTATELRALMDMLESASYRQTLPKRWEDLILKHIVPTEEYVIWIDDELKSGEHAMTGIEYIERAKYDGAKYKHLRAMLQEIWNIYNVHPKERFDIDGNFGYDSTKISHYILNNAESHVIDNAHKRVIEIYRNRGRGRPKGARNKSHVLHNIPIEIDMDLGSDSLAQEPKQIEAPKSNGETQNFSSDELQKLLSQYVTHYALEEKGYINRYDLTDVVANFQKVINKYVDDEISKIKLNQPTIIELKRNELPTLSLGVQHRNFTTLFKMCSASLRSGAHLNVWIYGPAGTGKSTAAEKIASALDLKFYTNGKLATDFQVLGYKDGHGVYQTTQFRLAFENGGIYLADEIDGSMPDALLALNGALANGHCAFPNKVVSRHPNFIFVAAANTTGTGATIDYVGRFKQDAAFNDRFVFLDWPLDEALEDSLVADKDWLKIVRIVRANINRVGIKGHLITPRASIYGESLIAAGLEHEIVVASVLKKGLSQAQWDQVKPR